MEAWLGGTERVALKSMKVLIRLELRRGKESASARTKVSPRASPAPTRLEQRAFQVNVVTAVNH